MARPSFHRVLAFVSAAQLVLVLGAVAAVYIYNSERAARETAEQLQQQYSAQLQRDLTRYLSVPRHASVAVSDLVASGDIDIEDPHSLLQHFNQLLTSCPELSWLAVGFTDRRYLSLERSTTGARSIIWQIEPGGTSTYILRREQDGGWSEPELIADDYDMFSRPWYQTGVAATEPTWTDVYKTQGGERLVLDLVQPLYGPDDDVIGVLDAGYTLSHIVTKLQSTKIASSGQIWLLDADGRIVASSFDQLVISETGTLERVEAINRQDAFARDAAEQILALASDGMFDGQVYRGVVADTVLIQATSLLETTGLNWRLVVAVPESDFLQHLESSQRQTLWLLVALLLSALLVSGRTARWVGRPLVELADRARQVQRGDMEVTFEGSSADEFGALALTLGEMLQGLRERQRIQEAFGRYVSPELAERILEDPNALEPGGEVVELSVLMSDLRGFTSLSAALGPARMVALLNAYLARMSDVVEAHDGLVNDFIGDAILVLFGAPRPSEDDVDRAVRCAAEMQRALRAFNDERPDLPDLQMGIGVHTGVALLGNIGSANRVKYGVIGDTVNTTARIESLTVGSQILLSASTAERVADMAELGARSFEQLKGKSEPLEVVELVGIRGEPAIFAPQIALRAIRLEARGQRITGKKISPNIEDGTVLALSTDGARITGLGPLATRDEMRVMLRRPDGDWSAHIYIKVTQPGDPAEVTFTAIEEKDRAWLETLTSDPSAS